MAYQLKHSAAYVIPLSEDEQQLIGTICAVWAQIEMAIESLIGCLSGTPNRRILLLMLDRKDMAARIDLLKGLASEHATQSPTSPLKNDIRRLCAAVSHWGQKRNTAIHGLWTGGEAGLPTVGMLMSKMRSMESEELKNIAENLAIVSCHAFHIHWTYFMKPGGISPWSGKLAPLVPAVD